MVDVKILIERISSIVASSHRVGLDRPGVFHPRTLVDLVNVIVAVTPAAGPKESVESLDLVEQFAYRAGPGSCQSRCARHPVGPHGNDLTNLSVADPLVKLLAAPAVPDHQTDPNFQVLLHGLFTKLEHPAARWAVHGDRLFHEDIEAFLDGVGEVDPTERRRRGEDRHRPASNRGIRGTVDCRAANCREAVEGGRQPPLETPYRHGDEFDRAAGRDGHRRCRVPRPLQEPISATWIRSLPAVDVGSGRPQKPPRRLSRPVSFRKSRREIRRLLGFIHGLKTDVRTSTIGERREVKWATSRDPKVARAEAKVSQPFKELKTVTDVANRLDEIRCGDPVPPFGAKGVDATVHAAPVTRTSPHTSSRILRVSARPRFFAK